MTEVKKKTSILEKVSLVIEEKIAPPLIRLSNVRYIDSLQKAFLTTMPLMILGALAVLITNLGGLFAADTGLNLPEVGNFINNLIEPHKPWLFQIQDITLNTLALAIAVLNGYFLGQFYHEKDQKVMAHATAVVSLVSFLCLIDFTTLSENFGWPNYIFGSPSLFAAIIMSVFAVEVYRFLIGKNVTVKMPEQVPPMIAAAFTSLIPTFVVIVLAAIIGRGFEGFNLLTAINNGFSGLVMAGSGPIPQGIAFMLDRILWFVGLHGSNIVGSVMNPIWATMQNANVNAFSLGEAAPYMFTSGWIGIYVRLSVFPIAVLLVRSNVKRFKVLGKLSLPGSLKYKRP